MPKRRVASYGQERIFDAPPTHGKNLRGPPGDRIKPRVRTYFEILLGNVLKVSEMSYIRCNMV